MKNRLLAFILPLVLATGAHASVLNFFVTINAVEAFSWDQSSNPTPLSYGLGSYTQTAVTDLYGGPYDSVVWNAAPGGMFRVAGFETGGPQVYLGSEAHPSFMPGDWSGTDRYGDFVDLYVTTVSPAPEPGAWALLLLGLAFAGAALRGRPRTVRQA